jgi:hypothetical protein
MAIGQFLHVVGRVRRWVLLTGDRHHVTAGQFAVTDASERAIRGSNGSRGETDSIGSEAAGRDGLDRE